MAARVSGEVYASELGMVRIRGIGSSKPGFGDIITRSSADGRDTFHGLLHIFQRPSCRLVEKVPALSTVDDNESLVTQFRTPQFLSKAPYRAGPKACATVSLGNWAKTGGEEGNTAYTYQADTGKARLRSLYVEHALFLT